MKATAAVLRAFNEPLTVEAFEVPRLEPGQVLVAVEAAGVCGSDVHMWRGHDPRTPLPIILGHEGVGRAVDVPGERHDVDGGRITPGQRLLWERGVSCGECYYCAVLGEPSLCPHRWTYGIHRSCAVPPHLNGSYATHIVLDARTPLFAVADGEDPAALVAASCSGATAAHGFELCPVSLGDVVAIVGPGPLGAFSAALARHGGASEVVVIGGTESRLDLCRQLGATVTLNRRTTDPASRLERVHDLTHGRGADLVIEASGSIAGAQEALELVRPGGALALIGFGAPAGPMSLLPFEALVRRGVRVQGVWVSDARHTARALALIRRQPEAFARMVTHRLPLDAATEALEAVASREAMKAVLLPGSA
jgi:threonine dehydrogenase-like Zn-dependent dehydrogenase